MKSLYKTAVKFQKILKSAQMQMRTTSGAFEAAIDLALKPAYDALTKAFPSPPNKEIEINFTIDVNIESLDPQNITYGEYYGGVNGTSEDSQNTATAKQTVKSSFEPAFKAAVEKNKVAIAKEIKVPFTKEVKLSYTIDATGKRFYKYNK